MMRFGKQLRLTSVVSEFVDINRCSEATTLMYSSLLSEYEMSFYSYIQINHIDDQANEKILKNGKQLFINIVYLVDGFQLKSDAEKQLVFLLIVHEAFKRISVYDTRFDVEKLNLINDTILNGNFEFEFLYKVYKCRKGIGKILVIPKMRKFEFYFSYERENSECCRVFFYESFPTAYYKDDLFNLSKWDKSGVFIVEGDKSDVIFTIDAENCLFEERLINSPDRVDLVRAFRYQDNQLDTDSLEISGSSENKIFAFNDFINDDERMITLRILIKVGRDYTGTYSLFDKMLGNQREIKFEDKVPDFIWSSYEWFMSYDNSVLKLGIQYGDQKDIGRQQIFEFEFGTVSIFVGEDNEEKSFVLPAEQRFFELKKTVNIWISKLYETLNANFK